MISVDRGLYALRYSASTAEAPPSILVRAAQGSEETLTFLTAPGVFNSVLAAPGSAIVIRAESASVLQVTAKARVRGGSLDASINLELLHKTAAAPPGPSDRLAQERHFADANRASAAFAIMGHVSRRGDVVVRPGDWIAGPTDPAPIEGIEVSGSIPEGLVLEYQVAARGTVWTPWGRPGDFLGSRGRASALVGIRLRLGGPLADSYFLKASALFLGSSAVNEMGQAIEMLSGTGHDPLVGLKIELAAREVRPAASFPLGPGGHQTSTERKSRVRVFRAGVEQKSV